MTDQQALCRVLRQFARTMAGSYDVTQALYELSDSIVEVLGATAAGVALLDGENLRFVTAPARWPPMQRVGPGRRTDRVPGCPGDPARAR